MSAIGRSHLEGGLPPRRITPYLLASLAGLIIVALGAVFALEFLPRFASVPIDLPSDDYGSGSWSSTTYSVLYPGYGRVFVLRRYGIVGYANADSEAELSALTEYFSSQMIALGWVPGDNQELCAEYLPEAEVLADSRKGSLLQFQEESRPVYVSGDYFGDLACVAVLARNTREYEGDQIFGIVLVSARQSPLKMLLDYLGAL